MAGETAEVLPDDEVRRRLRATIPGRWEPGERSAYMVGLMVGARAPAYGRQLETLCAQDNGSPPEKLEESIRVLAEILVMGKLDGP